MPANLEEHKTPTILNEKILITEQLSEMNEKFHVYQSYFSEHPHRLCHAAFTAVHIHQLSTVNSENSTHTGTGHAHTGSALVHQKLNP